MNAVRGNEEEDKDGLKARECDVRCNEEGRRRPWCEDGLEQFGNESRHDVFVEGLEPGS